MAELPGQGVKPNDYYWYYGTLAMYQLQGDYWQRWNEALQKTLLERQIKDGPLAGTWDTDTVWGGYGGRIYTTAIATLSLEVYYRFLPLYADGKTAVGAGKVERRGQLIVSVPKSASNSRVRVALWLLRDSLTRKRRHFRNATLAFAFLC